MKKPDAGMRNQVRIIGGRWRGSKIRFPPGSAVRPTPDRLRETLFNWLQWSMDGAYCLDLFAGSGVLGLECLSRGAAYLDSVEHDARCCEFLRAERARFDSRPGGVTCGDFRDFLRATRQRYDVIFLDPPYFQGLLPEALALLHARRLCKPQATLYMEMHISEPWPQAPGWEPLREKQAGEVKIGLWQFGDAPAASQS